MTTGFARARWIVREAGSGTRSTFEAALIARGIGPETLDVALMLPSNEAVRTAVEAGAGVAVLSSLVVAQAVATGILHALPFELPVRPFFGLRHKERYRSKAADALLDMIKEFRPMTSQPIANLVAGLQPLREPQPSARDDPAVHAQLVRRDDGHRHPRPCAGGRSRVAVPRACTASAKACG